MSTSHSSGPMARITVRVPAEMEAELKQEAVRNGMEFSEYVRTHLNDLVLRGKIKIDRDHRMSVGLPLNPYTGQVMQQPPLVQPINPGYMPQNPYVNYYAPYGVAQPQPDAMDQFINEMRKMAIARMFMEMIQGKRTAEDLVAASHGKSKDGDFSMEAMMKYSMMQSQMDRERDREMMRAQQALEMARSKGDKQGEKSILDYITALTTVGANQTNQFMQQMMLMSQQNAQSQTGLFNTALQTRTQADAEARAERERTDQRFNEMNQQMWQGQLKSQGDINAIQLKHLEENIERIRTEKNKDPLSQLAELAKMGEENQVYKAAFNAAMGVQPGESWIAKMIPMVKELGLDKAAAALINGVKGLVAPKPVPPPPPMITPPPPASGQKPAEQGMPPPMEIILPPPPAEGTPLEELALPELPKPQPQPQQRQPQPQQEVSFEIPQEQLESFTNLTKPPPISKKGEPQAAPPQPSPESAQQPPPPPPSQRKPKKQQP